MQQDLNYDSLFDVSFYSCELGVKKPDTTYFEKIVERLELPSSKLLFIDDKDTNVKAAQQVGLQAFCFSANTIDNPANVLLDELNNFNCKL